MDMGLGLLNQLPEGGLRPSSALLSLFVVQDAMLANCLSLGL